MSIFQSFGVTVFSYSAHTNIFMVKVELTKPIERRINKIFFRAVVWEMLLYICTSFAGYFS